jgi:NAD(P)-dependent dehydrogenase (short-subunit alcohol dehydrogenase family)
MRSGSKVVLITGAASGIGRACAEHLAARGHLVYGADRELVEYGRPVRPLFVDVDDDVAVHTAVNRVLEEQGRIDVLVNNAGFGIAGAIEDSSMEESRAQMETNFFGPLRMIQAVLPHMRAQGSGLIVNVASIGGLIALPYQGVYSASKFALEGLSEALRMEVEPFGIEVVLIEPADCRTGFTAARRQVEAAATSVYRDDFAASLAVIEADEDHGADPRVVARRLDRVMNTASPRLRYMAGAPTERLAVLLKRILPYRWFAPIIHGHYRGSR